jgi:hypothetical protein
MGLNGRVHHPLAGARVDPAIGQSGTHSGQLGHAHPQATLAGVAVDRLGRLAPETTVGLERVGQGAVAVVAGRGRGVDLLAQGQRPAREPAQAVVEEPPAFALAAPGARLVVAIAPALTIGLVRPSGPRSTAASEELAGRDIRGVVVLEGPIDHSIAGLIPLAPEHRDEQGCRKQEQHQQG